MSALRRVRTLRLRAPTAARARRAGLLVEDALRTASLPDADGGRVYVVRRLSLPAVRTNAPAASIARAIEHRLASLRATAVHASDPRAAHADIVWFDDETDATTRLLRALLAGGATAWFWRNIAPAASAAATRSDRVRGILLAVAASADAPAALPHVVATAATEGWLDALLEVLHAEDGAPLLHAIVPGAVWTGASSIAPAAGAASSDAPGTTVPHAWHPPQWPETVARWSGRWDGDARALWLAAAAIVAGRPALAAAPHRLFAAARASVADVQARRVIEHRSSPPTADARASVRASAQAPALADDGAAAAIEQPRVRRTPAVRENAAVEARTTAGGLLFVVQLLGRVGFDAFLDAHAADDDPGSDILRAIARRTGTAPDDPMLAAIGVAPEDVASDRSPATHEWLRAVRRWSRTNVRIGLHTLVRRPALVAYTRTHIDVTFELRAADVRLRRAGLDLDPGWVPWLGRVVLFHYGAARQP